MPRVPRIRLSSSTALILHPYQSGFYGGRWSSKVSARALGAKTLNATLRQQMAYNYARGARVGSAAFRRTARFSTLRRASLSPVGMVAIALGATYGSRKLGDYLGNKIADRLLHKRPATKRTGRPSAFSRGHAFFGNQYVKLSRSTRRAARRVARAMPFGRRR